MEANQTIDLEWGMLIKEAMEIGLSTEQILDFLKVNQE